MAKPNYAYEKRQKELAKKQKKLEKQEHRKANHEPDGSPETETAAESVVDQAVMPGTD